MKKWKKEEDDGLDGNFPIRFLNAGLHAADRKDCLPFFRSGSRTETVFKQGQKWKKGEDGREQAVFRESGIKKWRAIIKI